ncbi:MAG TPA: hypothetical protein ENJ28_10465 [Gammaproteobacteria bacterium]|nr:hypothetical protein [Gammaproteobacteria bacterium]
MDWKILTPLIVVTLSAIFAGLGYAVRINREKKRIMCSTLYNLLEIWYQIRVSFLVNPKEIIDIYLKEINIQKPELEITENDKEILEMIYTNLWPELIAKSSDSNNRPIEFELKNSIQQLSEFDPILAYKLNSNQALKSIISIVDDYFKQIKEATSRDEDKAKIEEVDIAFKKIRNYLYKDAIKSLEKDLIWLSFQISTNMCVRTIFNIVKKRMFGKNETKKMVRVIVSNTIVMSL